MTPHTSIFSGPTSCGKTQRVLDLIEKECQHHFENIVILCSTLRFNKTYLERSWVWKDSFVFCIEPKDRLFEWVEKLTELLVNEETLFIVDDMIADETPHKKRQPLLELAISGRHRRHSLWFLTQSYTAIPKNLRRQKKQLFLWYPAKRSDFKLADEETNVLPDGKLEDVKEQLKNGKHTCLYIRLEWPKGFAIINDRSDKNKE